MRITIILLLIILVPLYGLNAHDDHEHYHMDSPYIWIPMTALMVTVGYLLFRSSHNKKDTESEKASKGYLEGDLSLAEYFENKEDKKSN